MQRKMGFPCGLVVKNQPAIQEMQVRSLGWEDPLEKEMATHSSILTWEIPWTEHPGGLLSWGRKVLDLATIHQSRADAGLMGGLNHRFEPQVEGPRVVCCCCCAAKSLQSCPTLCDPIDGSQPGSPIPGILQARVLEWVAISFSSA